MKIFCLACEVLARPLYLCAAHSAHRVDIQLIQRGLHNQPANLRTVLQAAVDAASEKPYDAIALGYGLCGQATSGITARSKPLVIPRAHDCITLFLGSRAGCVFMVISVARTCRSKCRVGRHIGIQKHSHSRPTPVSFIPKWTAPRSISRSPIPPGFRRASH